MEWSCSHRRLQDLVPHTFLLSFYAGGNERRRTFTVRPLSSSFSGARALVALLHCGEVPFGDLHGLLKLVLWTELNYLRACFHYRRVAWRHVVGVTRTDDLLVISVLDPHPAFQHVPVVRALAHVVR